MYLLGNLPLFKSHVNHFMAQEDSPCVNVISKCMLWVKGLVPVSILRHSLSLISSLLLLLSHFSRVRLCMTPQTAAHQAPPSLEFSRQEHWSGLSFPSPMQESEK